MTPERRAAPLPTPWQSARVLAVRTETHTIRTFRLEMALATPYLPGQHFVVRLTAPDGYTAARSYSAASPPEAGNRALEVTVERLPDGEVSGFLHEVVVPGDDLEVRGPIGGAFAWHGDTPALLVGGGSGIVPLMSMLRLARRTGQSDLIRLVASVRGPDDLPYATELPGPEVTLVHSRVSPPGSRRAAGRLRADDLAPLIRPECDAYVCGSTAFCNTVTPIFADLGVPASRIRVERFGPSGA